MAKSNCEAQKLSSSPDVIIFFEDGSHQSEKVVLAKRRASDLPALASRPGWAVLKAATAQALNHGHCVLDDKKAEEEPIDLEHQYGIAERGEPGGRKEQTPFLLLARHACTPV